MGERVSDTIFDEAPRRGRPSKYPWGDWLDGSTWRIRRGYDYDVSTDNMQVNLHIKATEKGRKVRTRRFRDEHGEGLHFQFFTPEGP